MKPLDKEEISFLNYAVKNGYLDESVADELQQDPIKARKYMEWNDFAVEAQMEALAERDEEMSI